VEEYFGDAHEEAWQILNKKGMGLRARCIRGIGKFNPFQAQHDWVGILNHVAQTLYVPSYMSWNDEFTCEKLGKSEGHEESMLVHSSKVDQFENELMEKVSKQQRSKMNRVQVCTVAQLMTSDNLRKLMAIQQGKGVERHTMSLFAIDSCYLQLARDKHLLKGQDADPVEPDEIAASVAQFLSNGVEGDIEMFAEAGLRELPSPPPESVLNANFEPLWLTLGTLGQKPHSTMARILPGEVAALGFLFVGEGTDQPLRFSVGGDLPAEGEAEDGTNQHQLIRILQTCQGCLIGCGCDQYKLGLELKQITSLSLL